MEHNDQKVAVVTGGSRGIGRAIVERLHEEGYHVLFNYHHNQDAADQLLEKLQSSGLKVEASQVDVSSFEEVKGWIDGILIKWGHIDVLVNNAGVTSDKPLMMMKQEDWSRVMDINLNGVFNVTRASIVSFMKQKSGCIINMSSVSGVIGLPGQTNYSASKGGINAFTKALAKEVAKFQIRVNAIAPGFIDTDMTDNIKQSHADEIVSQIPFNRMGSAQEVANVLAFLISPQAEYITGQVIQVDGGLAI